MTDEAKAQLSRETIALAIDEAMHLLAPANIAEIAQAIDMLSEHSRAFSVGGDFDAVSDIYTRAFVGMSRRSVSEGLASILSGWTDTFRLPLPGIIRERTAAFEITWKTEFEALRVAYRMMGEKQIAATTPINETPEYRAETESIVRDTMHVLAERSASFNKPAYQKRGEA